MAYIIEGNPKSEPTKPEYFWLVDRETRAPIEFDDKAEAQKVVDALYERDYPHGLWWVATKP